MAQEAEYLALWLDCDREGENIGFEVISLCQEWIPYDNVYRAKFSALTAPELVNAYNNLDRSVIKCVEMADRLTINRIEEYKSALLISGLVKQ